MIQSKRKGRGAKPHRLRWLKFSANKFQTALRSCASLTFINPAIDAAGALRLCPCDWLGWYW